MPSRTPPRGGRRCATTTRRAIARAAVPSRGDRRGSASPRPPPRSCCSMPPTASCAPAVLWMDVRAADEAAETAIAHPVLRYSGGSDAAEWLVPKAMWFRKHEPATWSRVTPCRRGPRLPDVPADRRVGGIPPHRDVQVELRPARRRVQPGALRDARGSPDLIEKLPAGSSRSGASPANLTPAAATGLGLLPRVPVAVGGVDAHMAIAGHRCGRRWLAVHDRRDIGRSSS